MVRDRRYSAIIDLTVTRAVSAIAELYLFINTCSFSERYEVTKRSLFRPSVCLSVCNALELRVSGRLFAEST